MSRPCTAAKVSPCSPQLGKVRTQQPRPSAATCKQRSNFFFNVVPYEDQGEHPQCQSRVHGWGGQCGWGSQDDSEDQASPFPSGSQSWLSSKTLLLSSHLTHLILSDIKSSCRGKPLPLKGIFIPRDALSWFLDPDVSMASDLIQKANGKWLHPQGNTS